MDSDGDGSLSYNEIQAAEKELKEFGLKFSKWQDVLKQCDLDGDGRIDFHEFFTAAVNKQKVATRQNLAYAFNTFDTNGDGTIDIDEFKQALPSTRGAQSTLAKSMSSQGSFSTQQTRDIDEQENQRWHEIIAEVDTNGDGVVSFEEFC